MGLTRGHVALRTNVTKRGDQANLAKSLRVQQATLSKILSGKRMPSARLQAAIQSELGIPCTWWFESAITDESARAA